jgi:hypothetical protein
MKTFLKTFFGIFAAGLLIFFWPAKKQVKVLHLVGGETYVDPKNIKEGSGFIEFDARTEWNDPRHIHWTGSYWLQYSDEYSLPVK